MATQAEPPLLWQFTASHFNEKVRWALDWKGIRYTRHSLLPGAHLATALRVSGQKSVPILRIGGDTINDSTRIIAELERRFPERPLYPADTAARARALELEEAFDEGIGVHVRRCVFYVALNEPDFLCELFSTGFSPLAKRLFRAAFPVTRVAMRMDMSITDANSASSRKMLDLALDSLDRQIGESPYLVGDAFTSADLTAAALLTPLTFPSEYPYPIPPLPEKIRALQAEFADRPSFRWAREMYRRHRGVSLGTDA